MAAMPDDLEARTSQGSDGGTPEPGIRQRRLSRRLIALIAIPAAAVVALGGQRTSQVDNSAAANQQVQQLASLGGAIAGEHGLTSDAEDEADSVAVYIAAGKTGSASQLMVPQAHFDVTNLQVSEVTQLVDEINPQSSPALHEALASAEAAMQRLKYSRQVATSSHASALSAIQDYYASIGPLFALDEQIASSSSDPTLSADVRALDALSRAEDAASEERAVLDAVLTRGDWQPGELALLSEANGEYLAELSEFMDGLSSAQSTAFSSEVGGRDVGIANSMLARALSTGQTGALPINLAPATFPTAERAWYESMTFELNQMRMFEQSLLNAIQSRSGALQTQATQTLVDTWLEVVAVLVALLAVAVIAARRTSSGSVHWV